MGKEKRVEPSLSQDCYLSIATPSEGLYKDNGSRFLSFAYPCSSADQALEIIQRLKKKYYDATHHCFAYRIGLNGEIFRINDDGEPSSTAGRPIYGEILSKGLSDILVVVVRYFGGVKLGVPGLIKAYKSATSDALSNAATIVKTATEKIKVIFSYENTDKVLKEMRRIGAEIGEKRFEAECSIIANVKITDSPKIAHALLKIDGTKVETLQQESI
ncbi:MAG: IMPACT family protein [Candidatus Egerieousia sp.]